MVTSSPPPSQPLVIAPLSLQEEDEENLYTSIQKLRDRTSQLSNKLSLLGSGDLTSSPEELRAAQDQLSQMVET